ncbi:amidohydrolase family protein [Haloglomus litoreum]|uniref:amidohydrolase family protein n=1 Tax=Haloglomus litoreum TaxID=3034026 RepID=UPI0023E86292|nr:amidohydrolase family protein [Haloglomus sp. DT116]
MALDDTPVVDAWMQHPVGEFLDQPWLESLKRWNDGDFEDVPPEWTVQAYEGAGVDIGLLSAWWGPDGPLIGNDDVADIVDAHPDQFVGVGSVPIDRPMAAVREVRRCVEELGFAGIRVVPWLWELPPNDRRYYPVYAECVEQDVPFCLQVGHTGPLKPSEPGRPIPYLDDVLREFPDLTVVAGHIGHPWTEEMMALATKYEDVYIDTSAYKPKRYPDELVEFMRGHGSEKVLFGTNYPMIQPGECLEGIADLDLGEEARERFCYRNAAEAFGLDIA